MSDRDAQELRKLDAAVDRIFKVVPENPYILSVPCDEPRYHYPSRQEAQSWLRDTPFSQDEERLQYMTYIYRDPGESCFVVRSQVDEDRDRQKAQHHAHKAPSFLSGTSTPNQGTKKKLSLSAYKTKLAGGPVEYKEIIPEKVEEKVEPKMEEKKVNGVKAGPTPARSLEATQTPLASGSKKRPHADSNASRSSADRKESPHPVKKPRITTPAPRETKASRGSQSNGAPHDLPPLLSPTFLPMADKWDLPPMLSPTLPPQIEAALLEEVKNPKAATPSAASNGSAAASPASDQKAKSHVTLNSTPTKIRPPDREKSPSTMAAVVVKPAERPAKTVPKVIGRKDLDRAHTPVRKTTEEPKPSKAEVAVSKPSLIVKLKYGKRNRQRVQLYLKLLPNPIRAPSKPKQVEQIVDEARERSNNARGRASSSASQGTDRSGKPELKDNPRSSQPVRPKAVGTAEKRPRAGEGDAPPAKRPKGLDLSQKPSTPVQAPLSSPAMIKSAGKTPAQATPRNDHLKSAAMQRSISNDSNAPTPGGKRSHLTPIGTPLPKTGDKGPTSAPLNLAGTGVKAVQLRALNDLSVKYNKLGRKLKHENQDIFQHSKRTDEDHKRAALTGLECILSYMLAYSLGDARRRLEGKACEFYSTWISMLPLFHHLGGSTRRFADLKGLHAYLGIAINSKIHGALIEKESRSSSNHFSTVESPQGGPAYSEASGAGHTSGVNPDVKNKSDSWKALIEHSQEAKRSLPSKTLEKKFPGTCESGSLDGEGDGEKLVGEKGEPLFDGEFSLPIGPESTPIQAIRFGVSLVSEWCKVERVQYETQLKL
ncbi:hypothetical protein E6O75_ATG07666 [Venturia nashicola]|uniref:Uncharacterized protein n=1 Tax=Venturia nashicola TaxID=86259 RepID=A0A4Z1PEB1_9PEZI|nr:hypothetical protein E6O75_ATG07666 [Venturia nashicola]